MEILDFDRVHEIQKNLEKDDEDYFVSLSYQFTDVSGLFRKSYDEMDEFLTKYASSTDSKIIKLSVFESLYSYKQLN